MHTDILKKARYYIKTSIYKTVLELEKKLPVDNSIVLECESDMDDNPRAFYEYLIRNNLNKSYKLIWIVRNPELCKSLYGNDNVLFFNRFDDSYTNQMKMYYYLRRAKYIILSHPYWYKKTNKNQKIINTSHGIPIKGKPKQNVIEGTYDYASVHSEISIPWFAAFYGCDKSLLKKTGIPRNDHLFMGNKFEIMNKLFAFEKGEKVIICLPTYRQSANQIDSNIIDRYSLSVIENEEQMQQLNNHLSNEHIHLIIKPHPLQTTKYLTIKNYSNVHYINNAELLGKKIIFYELLGNTDGLITDFSSVQFDYLLVNKPIGYLDSSGDVYDRGYLLDDHEKYVAGVKINSIQDLFKFISSVHDGNDEYIEKRRKLNDLINADAKAENCQKFMNFLLSLK